MRIQCVMREGREEDDFISVGKSQDDPQIIVVQFLCSFLSSLR